MSGCLVSRYSVARLWSEWEALETWEATLAVSYVFRAAWLCSTCSLLSIRQQSKLWLVSHFFRVTFSWEIIGHAGQGCVPLASLLQALPLSPTYCFE